jgi:hypothetical protein
VFEYHGWVTLWVDESDSYAGVTEAVRADIAAMIERRQIDNGSSQTATLRALNGTWRVLLAGEPNHRDPDVLDAFRELGTIAPLSYGLLHVHNDEHPTDWNDWIVHAMVRGAVTTSREDRLSPHVGVVEDGEVRHSSGS